MSSLAVFVGLDYHQSGVQVCILDGDGEILLNRKVENSVTRIIAVIRRVGQPKGIAIEACCGASDLAEKLHQQAEWSVSLAHPGFVARMKQSPDKTDFGDARLLADLLRVGYLPKVWLAPEEIRRLRRLVRHRCQLVDRRRSVKLRIRALLRENRLRCPLEVSAWTIRWMAWAAETEDLCSDDHWLINEHFKELAQLNSRIKEAEEHLQEKAVGDAMIKKLMTFSNIGLITAVMMRAEIGRFDRFQSGKQLSRFCGLSPRNASSGNRQADAGLIRAGNSQLRAVLMQLGQRLAYQQDGRWAGLVHRLLAGGKPKNVVVAAVANRYMRWLYHQMQPEQLAT
jgi:transposase